MGTESSTQDNIWTLVQQLQQRIERQERRLEDLDAAVAAMIDAFGRIDILVANAGVAKLGLLWEMSRQDWDAQIDVNLTGVWQSCKAVVPHMIAQGYGRIILLASVAALRGVATGSAYAASKAAVIALGRSLALEVGQHGITVNCLCPGNIVSDLTLGVLGEQSVERWPRSQAIPELLQPQDVAEAAVFLASDAARHITGIALPVDAGLIAK